MTEDLDVSPIDEFLEDLYELTRSYENDLPPKAIAQMLKDRADFLLRDEWNVYCVYCVDIVFRNALIQSKNK